MDRKEKVHTELDSALVHYLTKRNTNKRKEYKVPLPLLRILIDKLKREWFKFNPTLGEPAGNTTVYKWLLYEVRRNCFCYHNYQMPELTRSLWGSILTLQGKLDRAKLITLYVKSIKSKHTIGEALRICYEHDVTTAKCSKYLNIPVRTIEYHRAGFIKFVENSYGLPMPADDDVVIGHEDINALTGKENG